MGARHARAQNATSTVALGGNPFAVVVNPLTNKIYVETGGAGDNVAVIDGSTNTFVTIAEGSAGSMAINPVSNKIYISNGPYSGIMSPHQLTVVDGVTKAATVIAPGSAGEIAINPVTDKIYVANIDFNQVTVIDGATNAVTSVAVEAPTAIAVNPVTNKIYVSTELVSFGDPIPPLTVIDGATNVATAISANATGPIAVNPVTNEIYVANLGQDEVVKIDGASNAATTVPLGSNPLSIALNPVTNMVYVATSDGNVTVINGATNATTTVPVGSNPQAIEVNPVTNTIYVLNTDSVTAIDGLTNATSTLAVGSAPQGIAVNPVTNKIYVANNGSANVTVIDGAAAAPGAPSARLTNLSVRAQVGTGGNILIPGLVVSGSGNETLLIRGAGPGLAQFGVTGILAQPTLSLLDSSGTTVASNTGWGTNANPAQIAGIAAQVGAFAFSSGSADCALVATLPAGVYTVQISGVNGTTGTALAEVYEVSHGGTRLANISTRAQVGAGSGVIIPGFVISGAGADTLLFRADGPALAQFNVTGTLSQPSLSLFDSSGAVIAANTGWAGAGVGLVAGFDAAVGAFSLSPGSDDCAQVVSLQAGAYTLQVSAAGGTSGVALAEVYEAP